MIRGKHFLRLIIAGLVVAYVAIAGVQYHQYRSVEAVMRRGDVNALWSFLQLNVEYEKLDHALHQFELEVAGAARQAQASPAAEHYKHKSFAPVHNIIANPPLWTEDDGS